MKRGVAVLAFGLLLAGCGGSEALESAPTSSVPPSTSNSAAPTTAARTTLPAAQQEQVFAASMNTLGLTTVAPVEQLRQSADDLCAGYAEGATYLDLLNDLVSSGMTLDQATSFENTAVTIFCPEFLGS